jgi:peptide/nickel transport system substrate-binding protein
MLATGSAVAPGNGVAATAIATPRAGGVITTAASNLGVLDPIAAGADGWNDGLAAQVLGTLFRPPQTPNGRPIPDLATGYQFNRKGTAVTITLRRGVRFSDGTPLNPKAVIWNLRRSVTSSALGATLLGTVSSVAASGSDAVTVTFSAPDLTFIAACVTSAICDMASPTAFARLGANGFALTPVGAGPFRVATVSPQRVVLVRNPSYWDAKHVYLARWNVVDLGPDPAAIYQAVIQDTVQGATFNAITTPPSTLFLVARNHNVTSRVGADVDYGFLPLNAYRSPFNDQRAREALDFCTNRSLLATDVTSSYASAAYVLAGSASLYLPKPGGVRGAQTLMPYKFDPVQGSSLVAQLGGLSFQLETTAGASESVANALAAQWVACDIHAQVVVDSASQLNGNIVGGGYQAVYRTVPGDANPASSMAREAPSSPLSVPGLTDSRLANLVQAAAATASPSRLASLWHQIWFKENTDAIDIPILSSGTTVVLSHCLRDVGFVNGLSLVHAWLACAP